MNLYDDVNSLCYRNLPEPLMTFDLHSYFISAAKMDDRYYIYYRFASNLSICLRKERVEHIHYYVYRLPKEHKEMLEMVIRHLRRYPLPSLQSPFFN